MKIIRIALILFGVAFVYSIFKFLSKFSILDVVVSFLVLFLFFIGVRFLIVFKRESHG